MRKERDEDMGDNKYELNAREVKEVLERYLKEGKGILDQDYDDLIELDQIYQIPLPERERHSITSSFDSQFPPTFLTVQCHSLEK